jgi:hypothetical protein
VADLRADPAALVAQADRIDELRERIAPAALPVGFTPAGQDAVSAGSASGISAGAAAAAGRLWALWSTLGRVADVLRANAANYGTQEAASAASLSGAGGGGRVDSAAAPVTVTPPVALAHVYTGPGGVTPEQLSALLRSGAGAGSPADFADRWNAHAAAVDAVAGELGGVRAAVAAGWSGPAAQGADEDLGAAHTELLTHHERVAAVGQNAAAHEAVYRTVVQATPEPSQFAAWHQQLESALAADAQYPGVYTSAVLAAQQQLNDGYARTGQAYGRYATDPSTGQALDPVTGQPVDPVTGAPIDAAAGAADTLGADGDAAGQDPLLESGGQLLTGLLSGVVGGVGAAAGVASAGVAQVLQMATQGASALAKSLGDAGGADDLSLAGLGAQSPGPDDLGFGGGGGVPGLGGFEGGGAGMGGGSGSGMMMPAAATVTGPAPTAPHPVPGARLTVSPGAGGGGGVGAGMAGGMPMMPMMGGAGAAGARAGAADDAQGTRFVPPDRPNTARVVGATDTDRVEAKRDRRDLRLAAVKAAAQVTHSATEEKIRD